MDEKVSQDSTAVSREPIQEVLKNFCESVESQYGKRNSPATLKWSDIHMLSTALLSVRAIKIQKHEEKYFIHYVMDYIELVMYFVSSYESPDLKKQIKSVQTLLDFISVFFNETAMANAFIRKATMKVFDLFLHCPFSNISKKVLLSVFNRITGKSSKEVRVNTAEKEMFYMYKLIDSLCTYGDYAMQADVLETVFRLYGAYFLNNKIKYDLLPGCNELGKALLTEISINTFDADVRSWLNKFNQDSKLIFSIPIQSIVFGKSSCKCPDEGDGKRWLDFNIIEPMVSFFTEDEDIDNWNRIFILPSHVQKVEIKRKFLMDEFTTTIFMEMCKPCISYSLKCQKHMDSLDRNVKITISNVEREKITKLISHILPRLFGASFVHSSARISDKIKKVYKPLGLKVSRLRSSSSGSSSKRQSIRSSSSTLNAFKYSTFTHEANGENLEQNFSVGPSETTSPLCQLLINESKTSSGMHSRTTVLNNAMLVDSLSCAITDFSACSSRDSINSNVFSIDSNSCKSPSVADDSEMFEDYWKKSQSVSLKEQILQLKRACGYSPSANEQLMNEDVFYSATDQTTEEYETAVEFSEPLEAMKRSNLKNLDVMDLVDMWKPNGAAKSSQSVSKTIREMSSPQQPQSNKWSSSVLDNQNSVKLELQNDSAKPDNLPITDCVREPAEESEFTQDLFEAAVEEGNISTPRRNDEIYSDSDIFECRTQVFRPEERQSEEPFTALSMKVNLGIAEEQFSEQIFQSQSVKAPLMRDSMTIIENGVEMVFIDLTSDDDTELATDELALAVDKTKIALAQKDSLIKPRKASKQKEITHNPKANIKPVLGTESPASESLQKRDSQTALVQKPESNNEDINIVPKPEMCSASDFVKTVVEQDNSKTKIQRAEMAKVKNTKSKTKKRKTALKGKAYSGIAEAIPDSTEEPHCHELLDQGLSTQLAPKKEDIVKPKVGELEEPKSIAKSNSKIALEDNLAVSAIADVGIQESDSHPVLPADKPIPTLEDIKEQTRSQTTPEKKVTVEESCDNATLAIGEPKSNQNSNSQGSVNSVQNRTSELKEVMDGIIPKTSLRDIDEQQENQMSKPIATQGNLEPNIAIEAAVRENEVDHDLSPQIPSTGAALWEKHMSFESNNESRVSNVSKAKSKRRSAPGITNKASDILHTTELTLKAEIIKEDPTISKKVLPKKIKKSKPKANGTKKKIKTVQILPQPDMVQESDDLKNKDGKAESLAITVEKSEPKRAKKTKPERINNCIASEPTKSTRRSKKNNLQTDNIAGIVAQKNDSDRLGSKMDESNELKSEKPKTHSETSEKKSFPEAEIQAIEPEASTCNGPNVTESKNCVESKLEDKGEENTKKNSKVINILKVQTFKFPIQFENTGPLNADTVDSQKSPEVNNQMGAAIMEHFTKQPLQNNAITENIPTSVVPNISIVKAMVHVNADEEKEATVISNTPVEKPVSNADASKVVTTNNTDIIEVLPTPEAHSNPKPVDDFDALLLENCNAEKRNQHDKSQLVKETTSKIKSKDKSKTAATPRRKLLRLGSYSYLDQLDLDASSSSEPQLNPGKKRNLTKTTGYEKKKKQNKSVRKTTRKRRQKSNNNFGLEPSKHENFIALFNESRQKHVQAAYTYAKQTSLRMYGESIGQNLEIAVRGEPDSSPDKRDICLLSKSESSTPELTISSSDHYDWPEMDVEDPKGKKVNIIQNNALKRKSPKNRSTQPQKIRKLDDKILPTFDEIVPVPKEFQNAECFVPAQDIGFPLIKKIMDLIKSNRINSLTKIETFVAGVK